MRYKLRKHKAKKQERELGRMAEDKRQAHLDKQFKKKEAQRLREAGYFEDFLKAEGKEWLPPEEEVWVRKMIRKDVKEMIRIEREHEGRDSDGEVWDPDGAHRMDDKVIFGSSSEEDIGQEVRSRYKNQSTGDSVTDPLRHADDDDEAQPGIDQDWMQFDESDQA
jgi:hypothetical protein